MDDFLAMYVVTEFHSAVLLSPEGESSDRTQLPVCLVQALQI